MSYSDPFVSLFVNLFVTPKSTFAIKGLITLVTLELFLIKMRSFVFVKCPLCVETFPTFITCKFPLFVLFYVGQAMGINITFLLEHLSTNCTNMLKQGFFKCDSKPFEVTNQSSHLLHLKPSSSP